MNQLYKVIFVINLLISCGVVIGQTDCSLKFLSKVPLFATGIRDSSANIDRSKIFAIMPSDSLPSAMSQITNFNSSIRLADTAVSIIVDSLRTDGVATIITVYETDDDSVIGLWQIGSGDNRVLWLNSQRVSYDDFSVTYRKANEHGVIIHTMQYHYPIIENDYIGRDTLFFGRESDTYGDKNLCAFLYFPSHLSYQYKCRLESALAIRYGSILQGPYINSISDTLWNPIGDDSLYSVGLCGIGRDDSLSLIQPSSVIRDGIMTITADTLSNLEHVFLGCDTGFINLSDEIIFDDTVKYTTISRHWKLRAHTYGNAATVRISVNLPIPADALRLKFSTVDTFSIITADTTNSFTINDITDGQDCYLSLLVNLSTILATEGKYSHNSHEKKDIASYDKFFLGNFHGIDERDFNIRITPNPSSGRYALNVDQSNKDIINIYVVNANGRVVDQHSTTEPLSQYTYNGHLSAAGIYYVTVTSNGNQQTIKLMVVR
mgnify:CR=1 FL=1